MSQGRVRPFIIPVFLPQQGCPHHCIFCDQRLITDRQKHSLTAHEVSAALEAALYRRSVRGAEVAFYGGTFTRLPVAKMVELLGAVRPYLQNGKVHRIRISTRPDALDGHRLDLLEHYGVRTVELGAQSMDRNVLNLAGRGHGPEATQEAVAGLRRRGFEVGIQLMPGLPGDNRGVFRSTVDAVLSLRPEVARIYPALVLEGTEMADWYRSGRYQPLGLDEAVSLCAEACERLEKAGTRVIRMGLMASPALLEEGRILAGPWHPAFGFLVRCAIYLASVREQFSSVSPGSSVSLLVAPRDIPLVRGHRNRGLAWLERATGSRVTSVLPDENVLPGRVRIVQA